MVIILFGSIGPSNEQFDEYECKSQLAYLAKDLVAFVELCDLFCASTELAFVRRSEQYKHEAAQMAFPENERIFSEVILE